MAADSDRSRRSLASINVEDQIREDRKDGRMRTAITSKSNKIAALRREQAKALAAGLIFENTLPPIHDQMGDNDITNAMKALNHAFGRPQDHDFTGVKGTNSSTKSERKAAGGGVITNGTGAQPQRTQARDTGEFMGPSREMIGPRAADLNAPNTDAPLLPDAVRPGLSPASGNPMLASLVNSGTLPAGASLERTGAGFQTRAMSESGERNVMIQPTGQQALEGQFGAVAQQQFGKPWAQLNPGERRLILKANPVARTRGEVLANGQGKANIRGERFMQTPGGTIIESDPSKATDLTRIAAGDPLLPKNALAGLLAPEKYADKFTGNRVASVSYGPRTGTGPVALDERGAVDVSGNFDIQAARNKANGTTQKAKGAADEIRKGLKPKAPGQTPVPGETKPPITVPKDPALLAKAKDVAGEITGKGKNPIAAIPATPVAPDPALVEPPKPRTNTFQPPAPSRPVVTYGTPEVGPRNTMPDNSQPLKTSGVWDALKKGNLSEASAHQRKNVGGALVAMSRGSAFEGTGADAALQKFAGITPPAQILPGENRPASNPVVNEQSPAPNAVPPPAPVPDDQKKGKNPLLNIASY